MNGSVQYITSMGELVRKDNTLQFRNSEKHKDLPIEIIKEIYCLNEVTVNSKLLDFLARNNILLHFFNYYGYYSGTFYPKDKYRSGKLLIKQVERFQNSRLYVAKTIVRGIGINIYEILYHYYKHGKSEVKETVDWIRKEFYADVENADNIKVLLAVEGEL